ncbi:MAG TPA: CRISPR-associated protein Cas5, partial [Spirochaetia bacterium]|nr:CRISPR-associated protein Cas5 [Spirochaetia bacterium]
SVYKSYEPFVYSLPVRFAYESDYGKRKVVQRKTFSFIEKPMILNVEKRGIKLKDYFIPLFDLR